MTRIVVQNTVDMRMLTMQMDKLKNIDKVHPTVCNSLETQHVKCPIR
jgi:hypothetical protein